jgi:glucosamine--fructose-6-phosphate aminotransferase (isomerizing)
MCGIVAAVPTYRTHSLAGSEAGALAALTAVAADRPDAPAVDLVAVADRLTAVHRALAAAAAAAGGPSALATLVVSQLDLLDKAGLAVHELDAELRALDAALSAPGPIIDHSRLEIVQEELRSCLDLTWQLTNDRFGAATRVQQLAAAGLGVRQAFISYFAIDAVLEAVDRLEVRGRDSAGLHVWVSVADAELPPGLIDRVAGRTDLLFRDGSAQRVTGGFSFVYKTAAIVGRLGDNVARLRRSISTDALLGELLALPSARVVVLAHTRWASVGRISESNAHPVNSAAAVLADGSPYVVAALNGDIDNHVELRKENPAQPGGEDITTDAWLIPTCLSARLDQGGSESDGNPALAACLADFHGSMAIAAQCSGRPDSLLLATKGSGQGLYVGVTDDLLFVASEVYGLVGQCRRYLRLDGTRKAPSGAYGELVVLDREAGAGLAGLAAYDADGGRLPVTVDDLRTAEVTTRDIARGSHRHYLEKELAESAESFRKTLRGRVLIGADGTPRLADGLLPDDIVADFHDGVAREVLVVGQGTAAVASQGIARTVAELLGPAFRVTSTPASEFSAWGLRRSMHGVLVVAVSQSGTTTDTNRAVDLAKDRGAKTVAVVNRRDSDLATRCHAVVYTSDGRDVEMAVASTKAFYSQVAAGLLVGLTLARAAGRLQPHIEAEFLNALLAMPDQLAEVNTLHEQIKAITDATALRHPQWAVVGSGPNRAAAAEVRIKLSELCYRTVSADALEDKKHIDLSAEALVLVCAAGTPAAQASDLAKEVEIFAAHRNVPVVITDSDVAWPTPYVITVPAAHPLLAWILCTAAGHLFAYHAALTIDGAADDLRLALDELERGTDAGRARQVLDTESFRARLLETVDRSARGELNGALSSRSALRLAALGWGVGAPGAALAAVDGEAPLDRPDLARVVLTEAIEELTRSIDSVKHQAKTVTVGTSRYEAGLTTNRLVAALESTGVDVRHLGLGALQRMEAFAPLVADVVGATRYLVTRRGDEVEIKAVHKAGLAEGLPSRADSGARLYGSKEYAVRTQNALLVRGARDGRLVIVTPELVAHRVTALTVLHVELAPACTDDLLRALDATGRLLEIRTAVTELGAELDPDRLSALDPADVLTEPVEQLARRLT